MRHYEVRMPADGKLPLPSELIRTFDVKEGDLVDFYVSEESDLIRLIIRNKKLLDLAGLFADKVAPMTTDYIDRAIGEHLDEKHADIDPDWNDWNEFQAWKRAGKPLAAE